MPPDLFSGPGLPGPQGAVGAAAPPPETIWALKPWWCQPWSIVLTGLAVVGGSWLGFQRIWLTAPLGLLVLAWWGLFLVLVPAAWKAEQAAPQGQGLGPEG